jgi:hypothetical protein
MFLILHSGCSAKRLSGHEVVLSLLAFLGRKTPHDAGASNQGSPMKLPSLALRRRAMTSATRHTIQLLNKLIFLPRRDARNTDCF